MSAQSCFTKLEHKLNASDTFDELKKQLCTLGLKRSRETLVSDTDSCMQMLKIVGYYAKDYFKPKLEKGKSVLPFGLGNEIINAVEKSPLVLAVHNFKTTTILNELGIRGLDKEPSKDQILILDLNEERIVYQSRKIA